jgi:hypothetical protein
MHFSFRRQFLSVSIKDATERMVELLTAQVGKTASSCAIPAIALVVKMATTRIAALNKRILKIQVL